MRWATWPDDPDAWPDVERRCRICGENMQPGDKFYLEEFEQIRSETETRRGVRAIHVGCRQEEIKGDGGSSA